jgi:hypothetical protein
MTTTKTKELKKLLTKAKAYDILSKLLPRQTTDRGP